MLCTHPFIKTVVKSKDINVPDIVINCPCGKCLACRVNRTREWTARLLNEMLYSESAYFVTLTYDEEHVKRNDFGFAEVNKEDIQKFLKRLRKRCPNSNIRYFIVSEYGPQTLRPHYHGCFFNLPCDVVDFGYSDTDLPRYKTSEFGEKVRINTLLGRIWGQGSTEVSQLIRERASYAAKYTISRKEIPDYLTPNFSLMSRKPGIGYQYSQDIKEKVRFYNLHTMVSDTGNRVKLPRYYKRKIYTEEEQKQLTQQYYEQYLETYFVDPSRFDYLDNLSLIEEQQHKQHEFHQGSQLKKSKL